jgi:hypothetical protein
MPVSSWKREQFAVLAGVEDGHAAGESDFGGVFGVGLTFELHRAEDGVGGDVEFKSRAGSRS